MLQFESSGSFAKTDAFLKRMSDDSIFRTLTAYGEQGVAALASATPVDSGLTASSWDYKIVHSRGSWEINWINTHIVNGLPIAVILQYGHGTGSGGYVQGRDYINPAIKPVFDTIADGVWKAVTSA